MHACMHDGRRMKGRDQLLLEAISSWPQGSKHYIVVSIVVADCLAISTTTYYIWGAKRGRRKEQNERKEETGRSVGRHKTFPLLFQPSRSICLLKKMYSTGMVLVY